MLIACMPESIDPRALNMAPADGSPLPHKQALENASLCLNAAKAMGCVLAHVSPADIVSGRVRFYISGLTEMTCVQADK